MTIIEFKKYVREWKHSKDPIEMLVPLEKLELLPPEKKWKTHAVDFRTFVDAEGFWNVYPIAVDRHHVYIICPWFREVHTHGNDNGNYEGHRAAHCKSCERHKHPGYVIQNFK